ncbi:hypothetical protein RND81_11G000500 [Saponaria officinalis]|uniref:non-specific serine/threonine protein kinase n=1 Tax=Saponaria officinalis TaxID=3572 RepID=A0AAW1HGC7_SAPOF
MNILLQTLWLTTTILIRQLVYGDYDPLSYNCAESSYSYSLGGKFQANLNNTLSRLLDKASTSSFANITNGTGIDQVYGLYYCTRNIDHQACHSCVQAGAHKIVQLCKSLKEGILWYQDCTLRYANRSIFSLEEETPVYPYYNYTSNVSSYILDPYRDKFEITMEGLVNQASNDEGFATTLVNLSSGMSLRGFVQCTPDILGAPCYRCLSTALRLIDLWANTIVFLPSCLLRFDIYGSPSPINPIPQRHLSVGYIVLISLLSVIAVSFLLGGFWFWKCRPTSQGLLIKVTQAEASIQEPTERGRVHGLARFTYSQVEEMTNWFTRKLGEGGYGIVYYGCLSDASSREVAVKVLSKNDAPKQFSTEIDVFGRISHKNLVSLVGYCEEGTHLALIYEYMARGDLKVLLTDQTDSLCWKNRLYILIDISQGLDYLHNGCSPPIVHRDVKAANILLNQHLHAKVSDFGISKIFPSEYVSNLSTRVVGTPGYLDPQTVEREK